MSTGAITEYIDVAQLTLYAFWVFFAGLIIYLHRENKREGYPLERDRSDRAGRVKVQGFPSMPAPKTYHLRDGTTVSVPRAAAPEPVAGMASAGHPGAAFDPSGNPLLAGVGPGAYAARADVPDQTIDGQARIVPLRADAGFDVVRGDIDPRGLPVIGADREVAGRVTDVWVDRAEMLFRYLEVEVKAGFTPDGAVRRVLLPINFARIGARGVRVRSILGRQFADVPLTRAPDTVTLLEEERVMAYYGAGTLYATPARSEPLI
jgi:photosynthetic reaction center H subunit